MADDKAIAKEALIDLIEKSRIDMYKPIQIAEILYRDRMDNNINLSSVEDYRTKSRTWRDEVTLVLLGKKCTSSAKYQDNLFEKNAIPPTILTVLGKENRRTSGAVEAYIYKAFFEKHDQLKAALNYCLTSEKETFSVEYFINSFWNAPGLKRSLDKIYEIVVYALFSTIVKGLNLKVEISVTDDMAGLLTEFEDFARKIMCLDFSNPTHVEDAKIFRVGVTNAADRGLDMYSNWGPAIQIKHLTLDVKLAHDIVNSISSDRIVIVCKNAEKDIILSLLTQIGWKSRIQSIVTENDLICWYEKALRGPFSDILGTELLGTLAEEIAKEFPSVDETPDIIKNRNYNLLNPKF